MNCETSRASSSLVLASSCADAICCCRLAVCLAFRASDAVDAAMRARSCLAAAAASSRQPAGPTATSPTIEGYVTLIDGQNTQDAALFPMLCGDANGCGN